MFGDAGLSGTQIGSLFLVWSLSGFLLEVPSGGWADTLDRRRLLVASGLLYATAFTCWTVWPVYLGFLVGFVLWSLSSALMSGTFEALIYDELLALGRADAWGRIRSVSETVAITAMALACLAATPLYAWGGYTLVGWASVGTALVGSLLALGLPRATTVASADRDAGSTLRGYVGVLRDGIGEAARVVAVRRVIAAYAAVILLVGFDEYVPLVLRDNGASSTSLGALVAAFIGAQAAGTALSNRVSRRGRTGYLTVCATGGVLMGAGALVSYPFGFVGLCAGFLLATAAMEAGEIRLQHVVSGSSRATVTSVAGLASEAAAMTSFGLVALGALGWSIGVVVAVLALPFTATAVAAGARMWASSGAERSPGSGGSSATLRSGPS